MLKQKLILLVFAMATLFVACHDDEVTIVETYPVELFISFPEKDADFLHQGWYENRQVAAFRTDDRSADKLVLSQSGEAYTGVSEDEIDENTEFSFLFPASASTASASDTLTQMLYINLQEGTLDGLANFDYAWGTYTYDMDEDDYASTSVLTSLMSFCKFQFTENGRPIEHISKVVITSPTDSIHVVSELNLLDGSVTSKNRGSMTLQNSQGLSGEVYAAFFPMETSFHFTISTMDGKIYEAVLPEIMKFEAGKTYVHADIACSALAPARIGDYYYSDGTWSAQLDGDKKCVGVVFALDDVDGTLNKNLSASAHGRVVAIRDCAEQVAWCVTDEDLEGVANQTILQDTMYVGSLPYQNGTPDSFFSDDAIEQLDGVRINTSTGQISAWYSEGALSDFNGRENALQVLGSSSAYYAFIHCRNHGQGLYGWYLPSEGELALLWALHRSGIICNSTHEAFEDFALFGYWTSTEYDEVRAWYINFYSGMTTKNSKNSMYNCRPVIRF